MNVQLQCTVAPWLNQQEHLTIVCVELTVLFSVLWALPQMETEVTSK